MKEKQGFSFSLSSIFSRDTKRRRRRGRNSGASHKSDTSTSARPVLGDDRIYVVGVGDSLNKIAEMTLGDGDRWPEILEANKEHMDSGGLIRVGQRLYIPET